MMIEIISIACSGVWIASVSGLIQQFKWKFKIDKLKPFDCCKCMSAWIGLFYFYFQLNLPIFATIIYSLFSSVLSVLINNILKYDFTKSIR